MQKQNVPKKSRGAQKKPVGTQRQLMGFSQAGLKMPIPQGEAQQKKHKMPKENA